MNLKKVKVILQIICEQYYLGFMYYLHHFVDKLHTYVTETYQYTTTKKF